MPPTEIRLKAFAALTGVFVSVIPARGANLTPDEVAMVVGTLFVATTRCTLKTTSAPLNVAVAKLGQDLVDFLPDGRYDPLFRVKVKKANEWMDARRRAACDDFRQTLKRFLPDIVR